MESSDKTNAGGLATLADPPGRVFGAVESSSRSVVRAAKPEKLDFVSALGKVLHLNRGNGLHYRGRCPLHESMHETLEVYSHDYTFRCDECKFEGGVFEFLEKVRSKNVDGEHDELIAALEAVRVSQAWDRGEARKEEDYDAPELSNEMFVIGKLEVSGNWFESTTLPEVGLRVVSCTNRGFKDKQLVESLSLRMMQAVVAGVRNAIGRYVGAGEWSPPNATDTDKWGPKGLAKYWLLRFRTHNSGVLGDLIRERNGHATESDIKRLEEVFCEHTERRLTSRFNKPPLLVDGKPDLRLTGPLAHALVVSEGLSREGIALPRIRWGYAEVLSLPIIDALRHWFSQYLINSDSEVHFRGHRLLWKLMEEELVQSRSAQQAAPSTSELLEQLQGLPPESFVDLVGPVISLIEEKGIKLTRDEGLAAMTHSDESVRIEVAKALGGDEGQLAAEGDITQESAKTEEVRSKQTLADSATILDEPNQEAVAYGKELRKARVSQSMSQTQLARHLSHRGLDQGQISEYECGKKLPDDERRLIIDAFIAKAREKAEF